MSSNKEFTKEQTFGSMNEDPKTLRTSDENIKMPMEETKLSDEGKLEMNVTNTRRSSLDRVAKWNKFFGVYEETNKENRNVTMESDEDMWEPHPKKLKCSVSKTSVSKSSKTSVSHLSKTSNFENQVNPSTSRISPSRPGTSKDSASTSRISPSRPGTSKDIASTSRIGPSRPETSIDSELKEDESGDSEESNESIEFNLETYNETKRKYARRSKKRNYYCIKPQADKCRKRLESRVKESNLEVFNAMKIHKSERRCDLSCLVFADSYLDQVLHC